MLRNRNLMRCISRSKTYWKYQNYSYLDNSTSLKCHNQRSIYTSTIRSSPVSLAYSSYQATNPEKSSSGSPIVIMHGLLGSKMNWKSISKAINTKTGRLVFSADARNHGDSPHTDEMSYMLMAEDLLYFLQERSIDKAVLMGHSMGGRTVMAAALIEPNIVDKLIVLDISPLSTSLNISTLPIFVEVMRRLQIPSSYNIAQARAYADEKLATVVPEIGIRQFLLSNLVHNGEEYKWRVNVDAIASNFNPHISTFKPPGDGYFEGETAFIAGALSDYIRPEEEDAILDIFPAATFHYLEGAGHWLHADKPQEFLNLLIPLLG